MLAKKQIQLVNSLKTKKFREIHNLFIAEGPKIVEDILASPLLVESVFATKAWVEKNCSILKNKDTNINEVSEKEIQRISSLKTANSVLATVKIPQNKPDMNSIRSGISLVLDSIGDPGNMGTILRIADWFGISNIICSEECVDVYNPKVIQASMGSIARVNIFYTNLSAFLKEICSEVKVYGTTVSSDGKNICDKKLEKRAVIIIGNESAGISEKLLPYISENIYIPCSSAGNIDSLNAAVATGIICYEFQRQNLL